MKKWNISPKNLKKDQLLIILLAGILLVIIAIPTGGSSDKKSSEKPVQEQQEDPSAVSEAAYEAELEERLKTVLGMVEGVGEVEVMITLRTSSEKVVEKDKQSTQDVTTETDSEGGSRETKGSSTSEETLYAEDKGGAQSPYVVKEITPEIEGVVVIAEGGDNAVTVANISEAVQALFQVQAHKIKVMKMN